MQIAHENRRNSEPRTSMLTLVNSIHDRQKRFWLNKLQ